MIQIHEVEKKYDNTIIGPIDITFPKAGLTCVIGPNGAGKSTTLMMIGRLLHIDQGTIEVAGMDVVKTKSEDLAKIVTILRQENHFVTKLTVRQLVSFGRFPYTKGRLNAEDEEIISKYIDFLELNEFENRYLDELSGGQRQRAYVAMVLAQETEYVLLDEPLNHLDIARSVQMMKYLKKVAQDFGRTVIVVMHDINFASQYADRICTMKDGKIESFGTVEEIMKPEHLTKVFETDVDVIQGKDGRLIAIY